MRNEISRWSLYIFRPSAGETPAAANAGQRPVLYRAPPSRRHSGSPASGRLCAMKFRRSAMMPRFVVLTFLLFIFADGLFAEGAEQVPNTAFAPSVDGVLNDPVWSQALVVSDFRQRFPKENGTPGEDTEVLLLATSDTLYVGLRAWDSRPNGIVATVMKRDDFELTKNDQFAIAIDSYNDGRNGYWFSTNPLGVRVDAQFFDEGDIFETNWNGIWTCVTSITAEGWFAEIAIPFSTLRFQNAPQNVMGMNLFRRIIRTNEQVFAPLIPLRLANGTPNVSAARKYVITGIRGSDKLRVKPYGLSGYREQATRNDTIEKEIGLDLRYNPAGNLTASVSVNTDFAETEVDERQINLTRFNLFFPEKREFFLENAGYFSFGVAQEAEIFFSRRIGLDERAQAAVPILYGAKLTGKLGTIDVGALNVQTRSTDTTRSENFSVLRLKAGVAARSYVGLIGTNKTSNERYDRVFGVDWNLFFLRDVSLTGFAALNSASGESTASAYSAAVNKGGEQTAFRFGANYLSSDFLPDVGFVRRPGTVRYEGALFIPKYLNDTVRNVTGGYETVYYDGIGGPVQDYFHKASVRIVLISEDQFTIFARRNFEVVPFDFAIFPGEIVPAGRYSGYESGAQITTKPGRTISADILFQTGGFYAGNHHSAIATLQWKINKHFTVSQTYGSDRVKLPGGDFRTQLTRSRIQYSFNTNLSVDSQIQYDNASRETGVHIRFGYLFREGTELFLVYGDTLESDRRIYLRPQDKRNKAVLLKMTYLFQF